MLLPRRRGWPLCSGCPDRWSRLGQHADFPSGPVEDLERFTETLQARIAGDDPVARLRAVRDQALILIGFWRAFRADELSHLRIEHIQLHSGKQLEIHLGSSKTDRDHRG